MVIAAYLPHDAETAALCSGAILPVVKRAIQGGYSVVLMGDLSTQSPANAVLLARLTAATLVDVGDMLNMTEPTRFPEGDQPGVPHRLGYIMMSPDRTAGISRDDMTIDKTGCPGHGQCFQRDIDGRLAARHVTLDHAAVRVENFVMLSAMLRPGLAARFRIAQASSVSRIPDWRKASAGQREEYEHALEGSLAGGGFGADIDRGDVEAAWGAFR